MFLDDYISYQTKTYISMMIRIMDLFRELKHMILYLENIISVFSQLFGFIKLSRTLFYQ